MRTEQEIRDERDRLVRIEDTKPATPKEPLYGSPYIEHLQSSLRIEKAARVAILNWVLGAELK